MCKMGILISGSMLQIPEELRRLKEVLASANKPCALGDPAGHTAGQTAAQKAHVSDAGPGTPQRSESRVRLAPNDHAGTTSTGQPREACGTSGLHIQNSETACSTLKQCDQNVACEALASDDVRPPSLGCPSLQGRYTPDRWISRQKNFPTSGKLATGWEDTNLRPRSDDVTSDGVDTVDHSSKRLPISDHLWNGPAQGAHWKDQVRRGGGHHDATDSCKLIAHLSPEMCVRKEHHEKRMAIVHSFLHDVAASSWGTGYDCMR